MSGTTVTEEHPRRVRHQARDAVLLMLLSAGLSVGCAALLAVTALVGR